MSSSKLLNIIDCTIAFINSCDTYLNSFNKELNDAKIKLNDGRSIGVIGLGTFLWPREARFDKVEENKLSEAELKQHNHKDTKEINQFKNAVITAVHYGYTHIDTAQRYRTEYIVGDAIELLLHDKHKNIKRTDLFITTKIARSIRDKERATTCIEQSLKNLKSDYIDLMLIHSPHTDIDKETGKRGQDIIDIYEVMIEAQKQGKIKSIGVSNFGIKHLETFAKLKLQKPAVNQIEISPFIYEKELIEYCQQNDIVLAAYCPLSQAHDIATQNELLNNLGKKYNKSWAQIMLRWGLQKGFVLLPKSVTSSRIRENGNIFDFELSEDEMREVDQLSEANARQCWNPLNEEWDL